MSVEENKSLIRRWYEEWNKGNMEGVFALHAPDIIDHDPLPGQPAGIEGVKFALNMFQNAFPGNQISVDRLIAEGDKVVDNVTLRGTHSGALMGIPPTGKGVEVMATNIWRIVNGKIIEAWHIEDIMGIMQQIGAIPAPNQAGH